MCLFPHPALGSHPNQWNQPKRATRHYPLGYPSAAHAMVPMGALLKAMLVNSAQRMADAEANAHNAKYGISYPNFDQGFGAVALKYATYFEVRL